MRNLKIILTGLPVARVPVLAQFLETFLGVTWNYTYDTSRVREFVELNQKIIDQNDFDIHNPELKKLTLTNEAIKEECVKFVREFSGGYPVLWTSATSVFCLSIWADIIAPDDFGVIYFYRNRKDTLEAMQRYMHYLPNSAQAHNDFIDLWEKITRENLKGLKSIDVAYDELFGNWATIVLKVAKFFEIEFTAERLDRIGGLVDARRMLKAIDGDEYHNHMWDIVP